MSGGEGIMEMARHILGMAAAMEARFHELVAGMVRDAVRRGESPAQIRRRLIEYFLTEPTLQAADPRERRRVVAGIGRAIDEALEVPSAEGAGPDDEPTVHEVRLGSVSIAMRGEGPAFRAKVERLGGEEAGASSFGSDDLPALSRAASLAHQWVLAHLAVAGPAR